MNRYNEAKHVLLVEDNLDDQELTRLALEQTGRPCLMEVVRDGEEAIAYLEAASRGKHPMPHLVLLDLNLPKLDGPEVLTWLRANLTLRFLPVVMLSTSSRTCDLERCYSAGANTYLVKPVDFERFIAILADVFRYWLEINQLELPCVSGLAQ